MSNYQLNLFQFIAEISRLVADRNYRLAGFYNIRYLSHWEENILNKEHIIHTTEGNKNQIVP